MFVRSAPRILILPGWQNSGPDHWQSRWERVHGYQRVEQHDWMRPLRGDWIGAAGRGSFWPRQRPAWCWWRTAWAASSGAWWAAHSRQHGPRAGALLVAPPDVERDDLRQQLPGWAPVARRRCRFASIVVASTGRPVLRSV
jgi:predicted alpha/beta hydrolase family esterase